MKLACCYGTRPEFIKIAPVVLALNKRYPAVKTTMVCSGQHQELLKGLPDVFNLPSEFNLDVRAGIGKTRDLTALTGAVFSGFLKILKLIAPDGVLVQGDAASTFLGALVAFHLQIPVFYVEAGLRTYDLEQPFPEEGYRQMTSRIASVLFSSTKENRANLLAEGIAKNKIHVVGNPVIDAVMMMRKRLKAKESAKYWQRTFPKLSSQSYRRLILVTTHRRENWGKPLEQLMKALLKIQEQTSGDLFVFSVHPNKKVRSVVYRYLDNVPGFVLLDPPEYLSFLALMERAALVITDSGGLQEETPCFGIPVLVVREKTERVEGLNSGWAVLAGTKEEEIIKCFHRLKSWKKPSGGNPYGDGKAAIKIAKLIHQYLERKQKK